MDYRQSQSDMCNGTIQTNLYFIQIHLKLGCTPPKPECIVSR